MQTDNKTRIAFAYLRLSREESKNGSESSSIQNQRVIIQDFCERNGITLVREFVDDGWSGGSFERFFAAAKRYSNIETLDRETLTTFIEKIEIGEKILPPGTKMVTHRNQSYSQEIKIYYKFIGNIADEEQRQIG